MFGLENRPPPRPPRYEAWLVVGLAVAIAAGLTALFYYATDLAERVTQGQ
jgi:hypothetical protein